VDEHRPPERERHIAVAYLGDRAAFGRIGRAHAASASCSTGELLHRRPGCGAGPRLQPPRPLAAPGGRTYSSAAAERSGNDRVVVSSGLSTSGVDRPWPWVSLPAPSPT
jgi:hypothetical protein